MRDLACGQKVSGKVKLIYLSEISQLKNTNSSFQMSKWNFLALKFWGLMASSGGRRSAEAVIDEAAVSSAPMLKDCRRIMNLDGSPHRAANFD